MPQRRRSRLLLGLGLLPILSAAAFWLWLRVGLPRHTGQVEVAGLGAPVKLLRDADGVAHIHAATDADASFALGYAHAQDRLWQLEFQRRVAGGRLSEILGESTLETDRFLRTLGLHRAAAAAYEGLDADARSLLDAYAAGVNAFLAADPPLPPEFRILRLKPEPWRPQDSLGWMKMMSLDLAGDYELELLRARLVSLLGPERTAQLLPDYEEGATPSLSPEAAPAGWPSAVDAPDGAASAGRRGDSGGGGAAAPRVVATPPDPATAAGLLALSRRLSATLGWLQGGAASNSWVLSGRHTASGKPFLANDPHLSGRIPSIWYLAALHGDRIHAVGATLPGLPGVVIGRNERIAWGLTSFYADTQDLIPIDPASTEGLRRIDEPIVVKGRPQPEPWVARVSRHGPLLSDVLDDAAHPLALRWTALDPDDSSFAALIAIDRAAGREDFLGALRQFVTPPQVFAYADVEGHIGMIGAGRIPIRRGASGAVPASSAAPASTATVASWDSSGRNDPWLGSIPLEDLPQDWDPPSGWLANANQLLVDPATYPYPLSDQWAPPYRMARIADQLESIRAAGPVDAAAMRELQLDQVSPQMARFAMLVYDRLDLVNTSTNVRLSAVVATMRDGRVGRDRPEAALLEAWFLTFSEAMLADDLPDDLREGVLRRRHPWLVEAALSEAGDAGPSGSATSAASGAGPAAWCDDRRTLPKEDCAAILWHSLPAALVRLGIDDAPPELDGSLDLHLHRLPAWGAVHRSQFPHSPFSEVPFLKPLFHRQIGNGGDTYTVNVANVDPVSLLQRNLPSYRQLIDLGRPEEARFVQSTGQSGHPMSPHYDDLIRPHRDGDALPMRLDRMPPPGDLLILHPVVDGEPGVVP